MTDPGRRYEFDEQQNAAFTKLGAALRFVAVATIATGTLLGVFGALLARATFGAAAVVWVAAALVVLVGVSLFGASGHFARIARTEGSDIQHLMIAIDELTDAFLVQRWFWIVGCVLLVLAMFRAVPSY